MIIFFDTETNGLDKPIRLVQIAWILCYNHGSTIKESSYIIQPSGFKISSNSTRIHGITTDSATKYGHNLQTVLREFANDLTRAELAVGHNLKFDKEVIEGEFQRIFHKNYFSGKNTFCTMLETTKYCKLPNPKGYGYKWPKLKELHFKLFRNYYHGEHNALEDTKATKRCFEKLINQGIIESPIDRSEEIELHQDSKTPETQIQKKPLPRINILKEWSILKRLEDENNLKEFMAYNRPILVRHIPYNGEITVLVNREKYKSKYGLRHVLMQSWEYDLGRNLSEMELELCFDAQLTWKWKELDEDITIHCIEYDKITDKKIGFKIPKIKTKHIKNAFNEAFFGSFLVSFTIAQAIVIICIFESIFLYNPIFGLGTTTFEILMPIPVYIFTLIFITHFLKRLIRPEIKSKKTKPNPPNQ